MTTALRTDVAYRHAVIEDVPRLVEMACAQLQTTYADTIPAHPAQLEAFITHILSLRTCAVFVAQQAAELIGMIGVTLYQHPQSGLMTAGEVAWWMDPGARGHGRALLAKAERWALERGAAQIQMIAPATNPLVGTLYERRGYKPLETSYQAPVTASMSALKIHEDVLTDVAAYRRALLIEPFSTVEPHAGSVFHGICERVPEALEYWIKATYPSLTPTLSFARLSPAGQQEPHFIHTDQDMGDWTAIAYLTDDPADGDGTTFWRWRETGCVHSLPETDALEEWAAWRDDSQWTSWTTVMARPNRVVLFPSSYFHSRAIRENYGAGDTARLIQVVFGTGVL